LQLSIGGESHAFGPSTFYDLLVDGRRYPPKAVVGLAARRVLGRALRPDEFQGGEESWAPAVIKAVPVAKFWRSSSLSARMAFVLVVIRNLLKGVPAPRGSVTLQATNAAR
jgi:hypothetical protein